MPAVSPRSSPLSRPSNLKKGGVVKKTGLAKVHEVKSEGVEIKTPQEKETRKGVEGKVICGKNSGPSVVFPPENSRP
jgi:hypothetical protein